MKPQLVMSKITLNDYHVKQIYGSQVFIQTKTGLVINLDIDKVKAVKR